MSKLKEQKQAVRYKALAAERARFAFGHAQQAWIATARSRLASPRGLATSFLAGFTWGLSRGVRPSVKPLSKNASRLLMAALWIYRMLRSSPQFGESPNRPY
jgi:hypothetical protein